MTISRVWSMPNKWTFKMKPVNELLNRYVNSGRWVDPFCGTSEIATHRNDLSITGKTAAQFVDELDGEFDGILWDPPYSNRQAKESYNQAGLTFTKSDSQAIWLHEKKLYAKKIKSNGIAISFGWNSNGFGKINGFEIIEVLLVAHGSAHNDTIVTVERKNHSNV